MIASVTGGRRCIRRSKSTRRPSSMSGVISNGRSGGSTVTPPPLTTFRGVEHDAERERDAAVEMALGIAGEVEDVAVEDRELAVELAEHGPVGLGEHEVRPQETEERAQH